MTLLCPACGAEMRILAFLTDPPVVAAILLHLDLPHKGATFHFFLFLSLRWPSDYTT
jgi:hypothetical protein